MAVDDPSFWTGAGAAGITGLGAVWLRKLLHRESLEDRLQRFQTELVAEVRAENATLRSKVATLEHRDARVLIVETCLRLVVVELKRIDPDNEKLDQVATMLTRAVPMDRVLPDDMIELVDLLRSVEGTGK